MMSRQHRFDYLLSLLPALEPIGSMPPISKQELLHQVTQAHGPVQAVEAILLSDDLIQRQALLSQEKNPEELDLVILPTAVGQDEPALPDYLVPEAHREDQEDVRLAIDNVWAHYFRHTAAVAKKTRNRFLSAWVGFEVGLRNALAVARAQTLELDADAYLVCPELSVARDHNTLLSGWMNAPDPLSAMEFLDKIRWDWLEEHERWYSFKADELEVYAARLVLLHRWRRVAMEKA